MYDNNYDCLLNLYLKSRACIQRIILISILHVTCRIQSVHLSNKSRGRDHRIACIQRVCGFRECAFRESRLYLHKSLLVIRPSLLEGLISVVSQTQEICFPICYRYYQISQSAFCRSFVDHFTIVILINVCRRKNLPSVIFVITQQPAIQLFR